MPRAASRSASARPMPDEPPVTRATGRPLTPRPRAPRAPTRGATRLASTRATRPGATPWIAAGRR